MATKIESHHSLSALFDRLAVEPLSPTFEDYGNFILTGDDAIAPGHVRFWGNFWAYSHVFQVETDDPILITQLTMAIRANQATPAYQAAKVADVAERERRRKEYEERERAHRERIEIEDQVRREVAAARQAGR